VLGVLLYFVTPTAYLSTGKFLVNESPFATAQTSKDAETSKQMIQTFILSIPNEDLREAVARRLNASPDQISFVDRDHPLSFREKVPVSNITFSVARNSQIGEVEVKSQTREFAAATVEAILYEIQAMNEVSGQLAQVEVNLRLAQERAQGLVRDLVSVSSDRIKTENQLNEVLAYQARGLPLADFSTFSEDSTLNNLKTQLILIQSEYDALAKQATRGPRLLGKKAELDGLKDQIQIHAQSLLKGLSSQLDIQKTREASLQKSIDATEQQISKLSSLNAEVFRGFRSAKVREKLAHEPLFKNSTSAAVIAITDWGFTPANPIQPKLLLNLALGIIFGCGLGLAAVFARHLLENKVGSPYQAEQLTGLNCLAVVRESDLSKSGSLGISFDSAASKGVGYLASQLIRSQLKETQAKIYGFTSASEKDCSMLVADLAVALAQAEKKTLVVDLHLKLPRQADILGISKGKGLMDWILEETPLENLVRYSAVRELAVLDGGRSVQDPGELLSRRPLAPELLKLKEHWDFILIDAPSLLTEWLLMLALPPSQNLIIAAFYEDTRKQDILTIGRRCAEAQIGILGMVLLDFPDNPRKSRITEEEVGYHRYVMEVMESTH